MMAGQCQWVHGYKGIDGELEHIFEVLFFVKETIKFLCNMRMILIQNLIRTRKEVMFSLVELESGVEEAESIQLIDLLRWYNQWH